MSETCPICDLSHRYNYYELLFIVCQEVNFWIQLCIIWKLVAVALDTFSILSGVFLRILAVPQTRRMQSNVWIDRYDILTTAAQRSRSAALDGSLPLFPTRKIKLN